MTDGHPIESVADLAALIRRTRRTTGMSQQALAGRIGTTRQWVIRLEQGHGKCTMSKVLDTLDVLGLEIVALSDLD